MGESDGGSGWIGTIDAVTKPIERDVDRRRAILHAAFLIVGIGVMIRMTMMGLGRDHDVFYGEPPPSW